MGLKVFFTFLLFHTSNVWAFQFEPISNCAQNLDYQFYSLCYSSDFKQAEWTFHLLTKKSIQGRQRRTDDFRPDSNAMPIVGPKAFKGSGFDRGHLVPAADMKLSRESMSETFYMTNVSPQHPSFNRGLWNALEHGFRKTVLKFGDAFVVTAPVLNPELRRIKGGVAVPDFYYKIAYFPEANFMMAFLLPNKSLRGQNYTDYSVSVDLIEEITGIDFFADLPDWQEDSLEEKVY